MFQLKYFISKPLFDRQWIQVWSDVDDQCEIVCENCRQLVLRVCWAYEWMETTGFCFFQEQLSLFFTVNQLLANSPYRPHRTIPIKKLKISLLNVVCPILFNGTCKANVKFYIRVFVPLRSYAWFALKYKLFSFNFRANSKITKKYKRINVFTEQIDSVLQKW